MLFETFLFWGEIRQNFPIPLYHIPLHHSISIPPPSSPPLPLRRCKTGRARPPLLYLRASGAIFGPSSPILDSGTKLD